MDQKWQPSIVTNKTETYCCMSPHHSTQQMANSCKSYINFLLQKKKIIIFNFNLHWVAPVTIQGIKQLTFIWTWPHTKLYYCNSIYNFHTMYFSNCSSVWLKNTRFKFQWNAALGRSVICSMPIWITTIIDKIMAT